MNRWIIRLALAGKWGGRSASGFLYPSLVSPVAASSARSSDKMPARPSVAKPIPERRSSSRRVREQGPKASIDIHHLICQQQQLGILLKRRELGGFGRRGAGIGKKIASDGEFFAVGRACEDESVKRGNSGVVIHGGRHFCPSGERLGLFNGERSVH